MNKNKLSWWDVVLWCLVSALGLIGMCSGIAWLVGDPLILRNQKPSSLEQRVERLEGWTDRADCAKAKAEHKSEYVVCPGEYIR